MHAADDSDFKIVTDSLTGSQPPDGDSPVGAAPGIGSGPLAAPNACVRWRERLGYRLTVCPAPGPRLPAGRSLTNYAKHWLYASWQRLPRRGGARCWLLAPWRPPSCARPGRLGFQVLINGSVNLAVRYIGLLSTTRRCVCALRRVPCRCGRPTRPGPAGPSRPDSAGSRSEPAARTAHGPVGLYWCVPCRHESNPTITRRFFTRALPYVPDGRTSRTTRISSSSQRLSRLGRTIRRLAQHDATETMRTEARPESGRTSGPARPGRPEPARHRRLAF